MDLSTTFDVSGGQGVVEPLLYTGEGGGHGVAPTQHTDVGIVLVLCVLGQVVTYVNIQVLDHVDSCEKKLIYGV